MTQKFTAEEVRAFRNITFAPSDPGYAITSAFADRIEADERVVPFEQLSELMRGLELGPASAYLSPHALYCIGRAIASQAKEATHPHSPDAADSGRVDANCMDVLRRLRDMLPTAGICGWPAGVSALDEAISALAAQGPGEKSRDFVVDDAGYFHFYAAPPASPAGVPDGWKLVPIEPTGDMVLAHGNCDEIIARRDWRQMLSAAPSAPEGDGGAE